MAMIILLPEEGQFEDFESSLNRDRIEEILQALEKHDVKLYLPRFSFSYKLLLEETLTAMGMPDAFNVKKADFTGMYDPSLTVETGLHISHVVHQAFIAVNEERTEAAAATGVVIELLSMSIEMRVDRPFIFLIRERLTGTILFLGRCLDPTTGS